MRFSVGLGFVDGGIGIVRIFRLSSVIVLQRFAVSINLCNTQYFQLIHAGSIYCLSVSVNFRCFLIAIIHK